MLATSEQPAHVLDRHSLVALPMLLSTDWQYVRSMLLDSLCLMCVLT